ncbi:MAG: response regulator transcription factor [Acidobacteriia bacterium]|nr:response regulator transcription factor [Terriglobia bacterium]
MLARLAPWNKYGTRTMASSSNIQNARPVRIFLLIDNRLLRETLIRLLHKKADLHLVGEGSSTGTDSADIRNAACNILVLDHLRALPQIDVRTGNEQQAEPAVHTILIGMEEDEQHFILGVRYGISAYLLDGASADDVVAAIRSVARGEAVCPPRLCLALFRYVARTIEAARVHEASEGRPSLTLRQQQLISLIGTGLTNKEIAAQLHLSEFTVRNHIHRIMKLVKAESRYEAVEAFRASFNAKPS